MAMYHVSSGALVKTTIVFALRHPHLFTDPFASVTISIPAKTRAVIVLSRVNERYWMDLRGCYEWNIDFKLCKKVSFLRNSTSEKTTEFMISPHRPRRSSSRPKRTLN